MRLAFIRRERRRRRRRRRWREDRKYNPIEISIIIKFIFYVWK
jgi:hypothetical protein